MLTRGLEILRRWGPEAERMQMTDRKEKKRKERGRIAPGVGRIKDRISTSLHRQLGPRPIFFLLPSFLCAQDEGNVDLLNHARSIELISRRAIT